MKRVSCTLTLFPSKLVAMVVRRLTVLGKYLRHLKPSAVVSESKSTEMLRVYRHLYQLGIGEGCILVGLLQTQPLHSLVHLSQVRLLAVDIAYVSYVS